MSKLDKKIFYGAAIQGAKDRSERSDIHGLFIDSIKLYAYDVITEHVKGRTKEECSMLLEESIGPLPKPGLERSHYIRNYMIKSIEGRISAAIFEVSVPSLGTGIEIAHAYMRSSKGLKAIPILLLYNLVFILPLLVINGLVYAGRTNIDSASAWKERHIRKLHLIAGIVMVILGVVVMSGML